MQKTALTFRPIHLFATFNLNWTIVTCLFTDSNLKLMLYEEPWARKILLPRAFSSYAGPVAVLGVWLLHYLIVCFLCQRAVSQTDLLKMENMTSENRHEHMVKIVQNWSSKQPVIYNYIFQSSVTSSGCSRQQSVHIIYRKGLKHDVTFVWNEMPI